MAVLLAEEGADDSCASARDGIAQVRRLCGGDEVIRVDADAQGFVAAVFADRPVGEFVVDQEREAVRGLCTAGCNRAPSDGWQTVGIRDVRNWRGSCLVNRVAVAGQIQVERRLEGLELGVGEEVVDEVLVAGDDG